MWTPIILATVVVLVVGEEVVVVDEKVMRDQLDTLVDQEDGASRGPRVERGAFYFRACRIGHSSLLSSLARDLPEFQTVFMSTSSLQPQPP